MLNTGPLFWARSVCVVAVAMLAASCGSSEPTIEENASAASSALEAQSSDTTELATETTIAAAEPEQSGSQIVIAGGSGDTWSAVGTCTWTPDNTGAASTLWVVEDSDEDGLDGELTMLYVWPMSIEDDSEPVLIGSIVEPNGTLLTVIGAEASADGGALTVLAEVHEGVKSADDPSDYLLTISCPL